MARKRRTRLTLKKKSDKKATPDALSEREFAALSNDYGSFFAEDQNHQPREYKLNDVVYMRWHEGSGDDDTNTNNMNHWIGKICQIRGGGPGNVWVQVQWYWSPHEVAEVIKSFDPTICGKYEKLFSRTLDIVTPHCVVDHVEVKHFNETCIYQEHIGEEEWYSRFEFSYEGRRITPKASHVACPICKVPYTPGAEKILHFCPKLSCCKFYHQMCLVKNGYVEDVPRARLLETWPDNTRTESVEEIVHADHPRKRHKGEDGKPVVKHAAVDPLAAFPPLLVSIADQPILRGTRAPDGGIVGNIAPVAAARALIYKALTEGKEIPVDWHKRIDVSVAFVDVPMEDLPHCYCPSCYSPI